MKRYFIYDAQATEGSGGDAALIIKSISELGEKQKAQIDIVQKDLSNQIVTTTGQIKQVEEKAENLAKVVAELEETQKKMLKSNGRLIVADGGEQRLKSFNEILAETLAENMEVIKSHKRGQGGMNIRFKGFEDDAVKETKAVGDMSISANFPGTGSAQLRTDVRNQIIAKPYERTWLADVLPGGNSSTGNNVLYPKENGGEGGAAVWTDPTADKAQMDFDLTAYNAYFKWIAGWVIIEREMLDDFAFMTSYLQQKMLISLKIAENSFILNGTGDTNPVVGLLTAATAYSGTFINAVDKVIDAGWGQIVEDTNEFYSPTHTILRPRDAVKIGLNKSGGSDEYDLPAGSVAFANGQLQIGGLDTVKTTSITADQFVTLDARATMFIRRMLPELRLFEDSTLAKKNKLMFRVEERATLAIFNNSAIVKGDLGYVA